MISATPVARLLVISLAFYFVHRPFTKTTGTGTSSWMKLLRVPFSHLHRFRNLTGFVKCDIFGVQQFVLYFDVA
jgi:hypothetical protein